MSTAHDNISQYYVNHQGINNEVILIVVFIHFESYNFLRGKHLPIIIKLNTYKTTTKLKNGEFHER